MWTKLMSFATNCSVPIQVSHPVFRQPRMHCTGTFNVRTIKQPYGGGPARSILFRVQMAMGGKFLHQTMPLTQQQFLYLFRNGSEPAAPERVLELVPCKCTTGCTTQRCHCRKSNLHCSAACSCTNCSISTEEGSVVGNDTMSMDDDIKKINCEAFSVFCFSRHVLHDLVFKWRARCFLS